ncbi:MAG: TrkA family potassium uptake protein [Coriobacteriia bacterium]|nr:TrkA family potassium uptake protein [Coriobacteriia bacterium]
MHVVIGGYGRVGRILAHELEAQGHTVAVIDRKPDVYEEFDHIKGRRLTGEVFDRDTLIKAGIEKADAFAACTSGDNSNIVAARIARERFNVPLVVARIFDPRRAAIYEKFGIPTVSSVQWSVSRLLTLLLEPKARSDFAFGQGEVLLLEIEVPEELAGKRVVDLELPRVLTVVSVERNGRAAVLADTDAVETGDRLFIAVVRESIHELRKLLGIQQEA